MKPSSPNHTPPTTLIIISKNNDNRPPPSNDIHLDILLKTIFLLIAFSYNDIERFLVNCLIINDNNNSNVKLVCYYNFPSDPNDKTGSLQPDAIDPWLCTHINVAFASVSSDDYRIALSANQLTTLRAVVDLKTRNDNLKVLVSVGGAGTNGFPAMVINHANRKRFIRSVVDLVHAERIDGIDLDWEFPSKDNHLNERMHFTQLLHEFRTVINRQSVKFLVTVAVAAPSIIVDIAYDVAYMNQYVDFVNLMSYDYHFYTKLTPFTGFNSPLYPTDGDHYYFATLNINYSTNYWISKGMDRGKIVVGLPTYAHSFSLINAANNDLYAPAKNYGHVGSNGFVDYAQVCAFVDRNRNKVVYDEKSKSPYVSSDNEWISFDDARSLRQKAKFIRDSQFAGAMVYALNSDDYKGICKVNQIATGITFPLTKAINNSLLMIY